MKHFIVSIMIAFYVSQVWAGDTGHVYSTGVFMEIDRCASAWLIKRYVDKDAVFKFFPDNEIITTGIPFDTPYSNLCRTHNRSTFEVILAKENISDKHLNMIAGIIHDSEINFWGNKDIPVSNKIEGDLKQIIQSVSDNKVCYERCFQYLDALIKDLQSQKGL